MTHDIASILLIICKCRADCACGHGDKMSPRLRISTGIVSDQFAHASFPVGCMGSASRHHASVPHEPAAKPCSEVLACPLRYARRRQDNTCSQAAACLPGRCVGSTAGFSRKKRI